MVRFMGRLRVAEPPVDFTPGTWRDTLDRFSLPPWASVAIEFYADAVFSSKKKTSLHRHDPASSMGVSGGCP